MDPVKHAEPPAEPGLDSLLALPVREAAEFADWGRYGSVTVNAPHAGSAIANDTAMSEAYWRFLKVVQEHPAQPSSAYPALAGMGTKKAQIIREQLIQRGLLATRSLATGKRGRESIVLELTDPGTAMLAAAPAAATTVTGAARNGATR